jgi:hypothetical protein
VLVGITAASSAVLAYLVVSGIEEAQKEKWKIISQAEAAADAADSHRIDQSLDQEAPAITAKSIWGAGAASS